MLTNSSKDNYKVSTSKEKNNIKYKTREFIIIIIIITKNYPCNRPWRPTKLRDVEAPKYSRQKGSHMAVKLSALSASRAFPPRKIQ
jgi:hypothetical protein